MAIHIGDYTSDAYDACQCDDRIKTGDTMVCLKEKVIGLAGCWPVAVTVEAVHFHTFCPGLVPHQVQSWADYFTEHQCRVAVAEALNREWEIRPEFERYAVRPL